MTNTSKYTEPFGWLEEAIPPATYGEYRNAIRGLYLLVAFAGADGKVFIERMARVGVELPYMAVYRAQKATPILLQDTKLYAYAVLASEMPKYARHVSREHLKCDLSQGAKREVRGALEYVPLRKFLLSMLQEGRVPMTCGAYRNVIQRAMLHPDLTAYVRKFVYRKMAFITGGGAERSKDLIQDLLEQGVFALQRTYPNWANFGHCLAIAKTHIHNRGQNIIKDATTESRNALMREGGAFKARVVSLSGMTTSAADAYLGASHSASIDGSMAGSNVSWETRHAIQQLLTGSTLRPKQREYLELLLGTHSPEFSAWLGDRSNSDLAQTESFAVYDQRVRKYLGIPEPAARSFIQGLAAHL